GAIENARLSEEARRRVSELEQLTQLAETAARAESLDDLLPAVAERARELLGAKGCAVYLLERDDEEFRLRACAPPHTDVPRILALTDLGPELVRRKRAVTVSMPIVAGDELLGLLRAHEARSAELELARAVA